MTTIYKIKKADGVTMYNRHDLDEQLSTIRQVTIKKKVTPKYPVWSIQLEGSSEGFDDWDGGDWDEIKQQYRDYVSLCLD